MFRTFFLFFASFLAAAEIDLGLYDKGLYSPNGEDGVLAALFERIPLDRKVCVEFNVSGVKPPSSTHLLRKQEWKSYLFDRADEYPSGGLFKEFINAGNVNKCFLKYDIPERFELLCIHVGFNDFHVWNALDGKYKPAIVLISYNGSIPPTEDKVVKYHPFFLGDETDYFGAGILSFYRLGKAKGYTLVYADRSGSSLFFLRDDLVAGREFKDAGDPEKLYRASSAALRPDPKGRAYYPSAEFIKESKSP